MPQSFTQRIASKFQSQKSIDKGCITEPQSVDRFFDPLYNILSNNKSDVTRPSVQSVWVASAVKKLKWASAIPIIATRGEGDEKTVVESSPILDLLNDSMRGVGICSFQDLIINSYFSDNEWFFLKLGVDAEPVDQFPVRLLNIKANCLQIETVDWYGKPLTWKWRRKVEGKVVEMILDDNFLIRWNAPNDYSEVRGIGALETLAETIESEWCTRNHNLMMQKHGGSLSGIVSFKGDRPPSQESFDAFAKDFRRTKEGYKNAGTHFITSEPVDYQKLNASSKDLDWFNSTKVSISEISAVSEVPKIILGEEQATYANYETARKVFYQDVLLQIKSRVILEPLQKALQHMDEGVTLETDTSDIPALTEDRSSKIDDFTKLVASGAGRRQSAYICNLPLDFSPENEDTEFLPAGLMDVNAPPPPEPPTVNQSFEKPEVKELELIEDPEEVIVEQVNSSDETKIAREVMYKAISSPRDRTEADFLKKMKPFFYEQRKRVLKALAEFLEDDLPFIKSGYSGAINKAEEPTIEEIRYAELVFNDDLENVRFAEFFRPLLAEATGVALRQVIAEVGGVSEDFFNETNFIEGRLNQEILLQKVNQTTKKRLAVAFQQVNLGLREGLTTDEIAVNIEREVKAVFKDAEKTRAKTIARTEVGRAFSSARLQAFKELGVERVQWISSRDDEVREEPEANHRELDGNTVALGSSFLADETLTFPQDPQASAKQTVNCRCVIVADI